MALANPLNGTLDLAGPEPIRQDERVQQFLKANGDARTVITDPKALYYSVPVNDQSLSPGDHRRCLGPTRFEGLAVFSVYDGGPLRLADRARLRAAQESGPGASRPAAARNQHVTSRQIWSYCYQAVAAARPSTP